MKESDRERTKLLATALNIAGVNTAVAGLVVPLISVLYNLPSAPASERLLPACFIWPAVAFVLHLFARLVLKDLDP